MSPAPRQLIARGSRSARHYRGARPRQGNGAGSSVRCGESREEPGAAGIRATGVGVAVRAVATVNVETFRRTEIKHAVRRKSFRAMRSFHVMRSFHANSAGAVHTRPAGTGVPPRPA